MNGKISNLEDDIHSYSMSLEEVKNYKDHGQNVDRTHIEVLNKEMKDMDKSYAEISDFFEKSLAAVKQSIIKKNEVGIIDQKKLVSELAIQNLDSNTETEFLDNKWLNKEVEIHRNHIEGVEKEVESIEQHNINIMSELFDKQMDDVIQTKQFYLACKEAEESHDDSHVNTHALVSYNKKEPQEQEDVEDIIMERKDDGEVDETKTVQLFDEYLREYSDLPHEDDYKSGPMEIKLLCVYGKKIDVKREELNEGECNSSAKTFTRFSAEREELTTMSR